MGIPDAGLLMASKVKRPRRRAVQKRGTSSFEVAPARNVSWLPGRKGQGGEGLSEGYGGSGGRGTGAAGPERARPGTNTSPKAKPGRGTRPGTRTHR
jgi:hypothetical protein